MDKHHVIGPEEDSDAGTSLKNLSRIRAGGESGQGPSEDGEQFYGVELDGRLIKTMYKEDMLIPNRALAVALAEEWDAQLDTIDMRAMHLNTMVAKGVRVIHDHPLQDYMRKEATKIFENDTLSFVETNYDGNEYKSNLRSRQIDIIGSIADKLSSEFGITLKQFESIVDCQEPSEVAKLKAVVADFDPLALNSFY